MYMKFGKKWRGHPIAYMARMSPAYCRWLMTVPMFKQRHPEQYAEVRRLVIEQLQHEADLESLA